jgi:hypothetical protein
MDLFAVIDQVIELLRSRGRVSYRALKVQFHLDDEQLDALKEELLYTHRGAVEEDGPGLVWTAGVSVTPTSTPRQGLEGWRATGAAISRSYWLGSWAKTYVLGAYAGEGLAVVAEALTCVETTGERYAEAEWHRLKGELLLKRTLPDAHQAEACFQQALAIARRQQAN